MIREIDTRNYRFYQMDGVASRHWTLDAFCQMLRRDPFAEETGD